LIHTQTNIIATHSLTHIQQWGNYKCERICLCTLTSWGQIDKTFSS